MNENKQVKQKKWKSEKMREIFKEKAIGGLIVN